LAVAVLNSVPLPVALTYWRMVTIWPGSTVPRFQVKFGEASVVGAGTALTCTSPLGSVSVMVTLGRANVPLLAKVMS
jgi:hypothetical protein